MKCGTCPGEIEEDIELPHGGMCKFCMEVTLSRLKKEEGSHKKP